jgi:ribosome biogenesis protein MAK21
VQVNKSGTSRDKIAASALLVQQSALHNLRALDELIHICSKKGGAQAAAGHAVDALRELFPECLLPDRRLIAFDARPLHKLKPSKAGDKQLLYWWMEDCVKRR